MNISIAIVSADPGTLEGLSALIRSTPGLRLAAVCATGKAALAQLPEVVPQVIVIEPNLSDLPTYWSVLRLRALLPGVVIIILARELTPQTVQLAVAAGTLGLVPVNASPAQLREAIFQVASGGAWMDPRALRMLVERLHLDPGAMAAVMDLSRREEEVLDGYARGYRAKEVAALLEISTFTVQTHVRNIYSKLGARSTAHAVARFHPLGRFAFRGRTGTGTDFQEFGERGHGE